MPDLHMILDGHEPYSEVCGCGSTLNNLKCRNMKIFDKNYHIAREFYRRVRVEAMYCIGEPT